MADDLTNEEITEEVKLYRNLGIEYAIKVLNRIHATDPTVLNALIEHRVPCNSELVKDPTVQVVTNGEGFQVGLLGIINGIFGVQEDGKGYIAADYVANDDGSRTLCGFIRWGEGK